MEPIPNNWVRVRIGDLSEQINGKAFKTSEWTTEGTPIIRIQNLNNHKAEFNYTDITVEDKYLVREGDLLFAWSGTPGTSFGAHIWNRGRAYLNQHIFRIKPLKNGVIETQFYYYALKILVEEFIKNAQGTAGLAHITKRKFENTPVPLPPLPEQKRIVTKLDRLFAHLDQLKERLENVPRLLKQFRQAVLTQAVTGKLTEEWRVKAKIVEGVHEKLGSLGEVIAGQSPSVAEVNLDGEGEIYITGPEQWDGRKLIKPKWTRYPKRMAPSNSIFVTVKGAGVGKTFPGLKAAIGRDIYAFVPDKNNDNTYVMYSIQASVQQVISNAKGLIPGLTKADLTEHVIYRPDIKEQKEIVREVKHLFAIADKIEDSYSTVREKIDQLPQAILSKAFQGQLVEQDPSDGSASVLLDMIKEVWEKGKTRTKNAKSGKRVPRNKVTTGKIDVKPKISREAAVKRGQPERDDKLRDSFLVVQGSEVYKAIEKEFEKKPFAFDQLVKTTRLDYETIWDQLYDLLRFTALGMRPGLVQEFDEKKNQLLFRKIENA